MFFSSTGWILLMYNRFSYGYLWFCYPVFSMFFLCFSHVFSYVVPFFQAMAPRWRFIFALLSLGVPGGLCGEGAGSTLKFPMSWMKFTSGFPRPDKKTQKKTEKWKISHWILRNIYEYITLINFSILLGVATVQNVVFGRKGPGVVPKDRWCAARVRWTRWTGPTGRPGRGHGNGGLVEDCYHPSN